MPAASQLANRLAKRIKLGDYSVKPLPAERELAEQVGVSRMTARKALLDLMGRGLVERRQNGRLAIAGTTDPAVRPRIAVLKPATGGSSLMERTLMRLSAETRTRVRPIEYAHWDDPVLDESIAAFDGLFLLPPAEPMPGALIDRLVATETGVVVLNRDVSDTGLRCVDTCPPAFVSTLLDHFRQLGHTRIDCLNTQPCDETITARIEAWSRWRIAHGVEGQLINEAVRSYENPTPAAYASIGRVLERDDRPPPALLCTTTPAAVAVMRRLSEAGLEVGRDTSVAAIDDEGLNRFLRPSLACLVPPDPTPYLQACLNWMLAGGQPTDWEGPLLLHPESIELFAGESVGKPSNTTPPRGS
ncbi:MAG: substrate-binding domain-containing protein [Planctomycetota bacterium]